MQAQDRAPRLGIWPEYLRLSSLFNGWKTLVDAEPTPIRFEDGGQGFVAIFRAVGNHTFTAEQGRSLVKSTIEILATQADRCRAHPQDGTIVFFPGPLGLLEIQTHPNSIRMIARHLWHSFTNRRHYSALFNYSNEDISFVMYYQGVDGVVMPGTRLTAPPLTSREPLVMSITDPNFDNRMPSDAVHPTVTRGLRLGAVFNPSNKCWFITAIASLMITVKPQALTQFFETHHDLLEAQLRSPIHAAVVEKVRAAKMILSLFENLKRNQQAVDLTEFIKVFFSLRFWDNTEYGWMGRGQVFGQGQQDSMEFISFIIQFFSFLSLEINAVVRSIPDGTPNRPPLCPDPFEGCTMFASQTILCRVCNQTYSMHHTNNFLRVSPQEHFPHPSDPFRFLGMRYDDMLPTACPNDMCRAHAVQALGNSMPIETTMRYRTREFLFAQINRGVDPVLDRIMHGVVKIGPLYLPENINGAEVTNVFLPVNAVLRQGRQAEEGHYEYVLFAYDMENILEGNMEDKTPVVHRCTLAGHFVIQRPFPIKMKKFVDITENMGGLVTAILYKKVDVRPGYDAPSRDEMAAYYRQLGIDVNSVPAVRD